MGEAVTKASISHRKRPSRRPLLPQNAIKRRFNIAFEHHLDLFQGFIDGLDILTKAAVFAGF